MVFVAAHGIGLHALGSSVSFDAKTQASVIAARKSYLREWWVQ
jgi:hypothetical protein